MWRRIVSGRSWRRLSAFEIRVDVVLRGHVVLILVARLRVGLVRAKQFPDKHGKRWAHAEGASGESEAKGIIHVVW